MYQAMSGSQNIRERVFIPSLCGSKFAIKYPSRIHRGIIFQFVRSGERKSLEFFHCHGCREVYNNQKKQGIVEPDSGAYIIAKDRKILTDPDRPRKPHICLNSTLIEQPNYGISEFVKSPNVRRQVIRYQSRIHPNVAFEFFFAGKQRTTKYYSCVGCRRVREKEKLGQQEVELTTGTIIHVKGGLIITDPDNPTNPHICLENATFLPAADTLLNRHLIEPRNQVEPAKQRSDIESENSMLNEWSAIESNPYRSLDHNDPSDIDEETSDRLESNMVSVGSALKTAEQDGAKVHNSMGVMYEYGYGVAQSYAEAVEWYGKAAEMGSAEGQVNLGNLYEHGHGVPKSYIEAARWYRKAAEQGHAEAQYRLGLVLEIDQSTSQHDEEAVMWYRKAAEQGHAGGQNNLGRMYYFGRGISQSYEEAKKWYSKAAEQGYARGQNNLGVMYEYGRGVPLSGEQAAAWYARTAEQGCANGQYYLGTMYEHGRGVSQSYDEAMKWYRKAAEQGNADGQNKLGDGYFWGRGAPYSIAEAIICYRKAAEQGHVDAQFNLALMYDDLGSKPSRREAMIWYRKAAEQGDSDAQFVLERIQRDEP